MENDGQKKKRLKWFDYLIFAAIIILLVYYLINSIFGGHETINDPAVMEINDRPKITIFDYLKFFRISLFEVIMFVGLSGYLLYLRYKRSQEEEYYGEDDSL